MLSKNELLIEITDRLSSSKPDFDRIEDKIRLSPLVKKYYSNNEIFKSLVSEIYLQDSLEDICKDYKKRVIFNPIKIGKKTKDYLFIRSNTSFGMLIVKESDYCEFDNIMLIDDLPTVFEIKLNTDYMQKIQHGVTLKKPRVKKNKKLNYFLSEERIKIISDPIEQYFKVSEPGYVVMCYPESLNFTSTRQRKFLDLGGILVPYYAPKEKYREDLSKLAKKMFG